MDPRDTVGRIYKEEHYTLLQTKYESSGPWTPGAPLAGFIKESIIHWSTQHMKALGNMVSEKKIFLCFSHDAPGAGPVWIPGARLAEFIKRTTTHCYVQNI